MCIIERELWEVVTIPTSAQLLECYLVCSEATKMYQSVNLVRLDERTGNLFILIGDDIEIVIGSNGKWIEK